MRLVTPLNFVCVFSFEVLRNGILLGGYATMIGTSALAKANSPSSGRTISVPHWASLTTLTRGFNSLSIYHSLNWSLPSSVIT